MTREEFLNLKEGDEVFALNGDHLFDEGDCLQFMYFDKDDNTFWKFTSGFNSQFLTCHEVEKIKPNE